MPEGWQGAVGEMLDIPNFLKRDHPDYGKVPGPEKTVVGKPPHEAMPEPVKKQEPAIVHPNLGKPETVWPYRNAQGETVMFQCRFKGDGERTKTYRPNSKQPDGSWKWAGCSVPRPLYQLDRLAVRPNAPVIVVEGEKAADALQGVLTDHVVTTAMHGAQSPHTADWSPLAGRDVTVWPDADEAGRGYGEAVMGLLSEAGAASVRIVPVYIYGERATIGEPEADQANPVYVPTGWDAADAVAEGWDEARIRYVVENAVPAVMDSPTLGNVGNSVPLPNVNGTGPDMSILRADVSRPVFPVETFGPFWGRFIRDRAEGVSAPPDYVGAAVLAAAASVIGNARRASPWETWTEPSVLWMTCVGTPSSGKSPAMDPVLSLLRELEGDGVTEYADAARRYETDRQRAKLAREQWEKEAKEAHKNGAPLPPLPEDAEEPAKPEPLRLRVSDTTIEALGKRLAGQPRGILFNRDELAGWFGNFDRYGGKGGDRAFWLEAYGGRSFTMERVKHGDAPVVIPHLSVSILGTIQPDRMKSLFMQGDDDGLPARFLFVWPDPVPRRRPTAMGGVQDALRAFRRLMGLAMGTDDKGRPEPIILPLSPDAADLFENWWQAEPGKEPSGRMAGWWGKCPGYVLRLALVLQFLWWSAEEDETEPDQIGMAAIDAAIRLVDDYFKPMAALCHGDAAQPEEKRLAAALARAILERRPEIINARDVYKTWGISGLTDAESAKVAIAELEQAGWLQRILTSTNEKGGRPRDDYRVLSPP